MIGLLLGVLSLSILTGFFIPKRESVQGILGKIPVQSGGRVKPFESFAREALLSVTGKTSLNSQEATIILWEWLVKPEEWHTKSFIPVRHKRLAEEFSLMVIGGKISPEIVLTHAPFQERMVQALTKEEKKESLTPLEKKRIELYDQARLFQAVAQGSLPGFFPDPEDPQAGWISLSGLADPERRGLLESRFPPPVLAAVQASLARFVGVLRGEGEGDLSETAVQFRASLHELLESQGITLNTARISAEIFYNHLRPFQWAWILYLASALLWFFLKDRMPFLAIGFFTLGLVIHTFGFSLRCYIAARPPVSNMYESITWVAWAAIFFSGLLGLVYRKSILPASAACVASLGLLVGESFPMVLDPSLTPLVPVLRNNFWLTAHVLTITVSYGAFALAWGLAHVSLLNLAFHPEKEEDGKQLGEYLYRALQIGVVLLAAGTILGGVWANDSWGRFWGWDPKETWALIALLGYLVVLHGRSAGWLGSFGMAIGSVIAFLGILMAWYGVNFVLAAGLHSYGFGGGGFPYVLAAALIDLAFVSILAFRYNAFRRSFIRQSS